MLFFFESLISERLVHSGNRVFTEMSAQGLDAELPMFVLGEVRDGDDVPSLVQERRVRFDDTRNEVHEYKADPLTRSRLRGRLRNGALRRIRKSIRAHRTKRPFVSAAVLEDVAFAPSLDETDDADMDPEARGTQELTEAINNIGAAVLADAEHASRLLRQREEGLVRGPPDIETAVVSTDDEVDDEDEDAA